MERASAERLYERAAVLRDRRERVAALLERLGGLLRAAHAGSRLVLARHPVKQSWDAFWLVAGRVADWGPLPADAHDIEERSRAALALAARRDARQVAPGEVHELRIVSSWLAGDDAFEQELEADLRGWVADVAGVPL